MRYLILLALVGCAHTIGEGVTVTNTQTVKRDRPIDLQNAAPPKTDNLACNRGHPVTCCCDAAISGEVICICDGKHLTIKE